MSLIRYMQAWFSTEYAVEWVKFENPDVEMILRRVDGNGVLLEVRPKDSIKVHSIGIAPDDAVRLGRYLLAVAAAQGANVNDGVTGVLG